MENMSLFNQLCDTPKEAQKPIKGGRLNGFTDINPMWRIKRLTEVFGPCGIGWKYIIRNQRTIDSGSEVAAFVDIDLFYMIGDKWADPIPGIGGSMLVSREKNGLHLSDEAFKMALTDAIGTACKALGMSSDIYWAGGRTKYNTAPPEQPKQQSLVCSCCGKEIQGVRWKSGKQLTPEQILENSRAMFGVDLCYQCLKERIDATANK